MAVPFLDLGRLHDAIRGELDRAYARVLTSGAFVDGPDVGVFEDAFAQAHGLEFGAGCGSGTDALVLALAALGVGAGDEVVVPAMTFVATAEAVVHAGAKPVLADVDPVTLLLTPDTVAAVTSDRTKAVIPVHLYGHVVPPSAIAEWRRQGLKVLEDAAQAHLASHEGQMVGSSGDVTCFSFYPGKNLGAFGDGGMVVSPDRELIERVRRLRDHGSAEKYVHAEMGWCSRLDTLQAAWLNVKLQHLDEWTDLRRKVTARYADEIGDALVPWDQGAVHHLLVSRVASDRRDAVNKALSVAGIGTGIHYPFALSQQPAMGSGWHCPNAEQAASEVLSLPMDPYLSDDDVLEVVEAFRQATA